MKKYLIDNNGCDDTTRVEMELTEQELEIIVKFAKENNKNSSCGCQPKISIYSKYVVDENGDYDVDYNSELVI